MALRGVTRSGMVMWVDIKLSMLVFSLTEGWGVAMLTRLGSNSPGSLLGVSLEIFEKLLANRSAIRVVGYCAWIH